MHGTDDKVVLSNHLIDDFCEKYKFYIPESNKNFYSPGDLKAFLRARLDFFLNRKEEIKILVENQGDKFIWLANSSSIEILMPDSPFIVDTILDTCMSHGHMINLVIHPIFRVFRNEDGDLQAIDYPDGDGDAESYVYVEMSRLSPQARRRLRQDLAGNLKELRIAVADYPKMRILVNDVVFQREELNEHLAWIKDNFVFLGLSSINKNELGRPFHGLMKKQSLRNTISQEISNQNGKAGPELTCYQSAARSIVNKDREMFFFVMRCKKLNLLLAGHFRHRAELSLRHDIPAVKRMLDLMAQEMRVPSTSYMYKELYKAAQALPVGILMTRSSSFLFKWFSKILANVYSIEFSYEITLDQKGDFVWALILVPPEDRGKVPGREFEAYCESQKIRTLYQFRHTLNQREVVFLGLRSETLSPKQLQAELLVNAGDLFSAWMSRFQESIISRYSGEEIDIKLRRYMVGVSAEYEIHQSPEDALFDLEMLDEMTPDSGYVVYYSDETGQENDFIKIYSLRPARLSDIIPVLSNFGFRIDREYTFPFQENGSSRYAYAFTVRRREKLTRQDRERIAFCISEVLNKRMTSRILNELVLVSGLDHRELLLVKALCGYFVQIDKSHYNTSLQTTLVRYPKVARALVDFFEVRLDPAKSSSEAEKARQSVEKCFKDLSSVQDEKICRTLLNIVEAIVRTNFFMGLPEICFKIRSRAIDRMPSPAPHYEIYVYSYDLQGVHLRGGRVARGGIRWSDRLDDYRTEILGLMKAQMVKNTVIVPTGSKGGFVLRNRKDTMVADIRKAGEEGYKRFIGCLLDLTDSYDSDGNVIAPKDIKRLDDDDPYLVVAADKGTATFSDLANEISTKKGFWLDDAFASGGSNGYDHKKQGITAKGTWESVKRHFFEIGIDPEKDNITVVGIGDMSGDVFGNGMLLSRTIRLVAAFNHAFIFLDPTPDPEISFQERKRLFYQGGNWDDYNKEVLSAGGGIYERSSRRIELSAEVRHLLNLKSRTLSGEDLIHSILQAPADLLWNGGIGTYVKASNESQFQAGDSANDRVRIDASELNVRVVGEGGNLGLTQAARVEAAKRGVRLNSDAIDNFAGVNMSDHEVNRPNQRQSRTKQNDPGRRIGGNRPGVASELCFEPVDFRGCKTDAGAISVSESAHQVPQ
jgi:glutamate dehydrogenase